MKILNAIYIISVCLYSTQSTANSSLENINISAKPPSLSIQTDPITLTYLGTQILDKAKDALRKKARSLLTDAIFGSGSGGVNYALLHEESLLQIENIVTEIVINSSVADAISQLSSFETRIEYYNETARFNEPDLTYLPLLINDATSLRFHQAYNVSYNPNAPLLTSSYALVSSLSLAVLTEKELQGAVSHDYVASIAQELYNTLTDLGAKANNYISSNVYLTGPTGWCNNIIIFSNDSYINQKNYSINKLLATGKNHQTDSDLQTTDCSYTVYDNIANVVYKYKFRDFGKTLARRLAYQVKNNLTDNYKAQFKGEEFDAIVTNIGAF